MRRKRIDKTAEDYDASLHIRAYNVLKGMRARSRKRNTKMSISLFDMYELLKESHICPILGVEMTWSQGKYDPLCRSVDKIDPEKGYTKENIWIISFRANQMKSDATLDELKSFCNNVLKAIEDREKNEDASTGHRDQPKA